MSNVHTINEKATGIAPKPSIADVVAWVEAQAAKADMGPSGARLRITSLQQMAEQVAEDDPGDARWVLENIDRLRERWARRHMDAKADTAVTYASRAKTTISAYLVWSAAPDKYDPKKVLLKQRDNAKPSTKKAAPRAKVVEPTQSTADAQSQAPTPQPPRGEARNFPLGGERGSILFELPAGGVTFADVKKFAVHLFTLASDFDISDQAQAQVFGMVVRGARDN